MDSINVALLGFGTVGQGIYEVIQENQQRLEQTTGTTVNIVAVFIRDVSKKRALPEDVLVTNNPDLLFSKRIDIVMEATVGSEPAYPLLQKAIQHGCQIVTANKQMFAQHGAALQSLADKEGVSIGYEATTAGGIPVIQTIQQLLRINQVEKIEGILNGTSNFILTSMSQHGCSFEEALQMAQQKGYAEEDPSHDVNGTDAYYKLLILSRLAFGEQPDELNVHVQGIDQVTSSRLEESSLSGKRIKHVATIERQHNQLVASIKPIELNPDHPLFQIDGVQNAVSIQTNIAGTLVLKGPGAGKHPTASAMVEDLVHIVQKYKQKNKAFIQVG